jgi:hypothetical protein
MFFPFRGRKPWFAIAFKAGHGERTAPGIFAAGMKGGKASALPSEATRRMTRVAIMVREVERRESQDIDDGHFIPDGGLEYRPPWIRG